VKLQVDEKYTIGISPLYLNCDCNCEFELREVTNNYELDKNITSTLEEIQSMTPTPPYTKLQYPSPKLYLTMELNRLRSPTNSLEVLAPRLTGHEDNIITEDDTILLNELPIVTNVRTPTKLATIKRVGSAIKAPHYVHVPF